MGFLLNGKNISESKSGHALSLSWTLALKASRRYRELGSRSQYILHTHKCSSARRTHKEHALAFSLQSARRLPGSESIFFGLVPCDHAFAVTAWIWLGTRMLIWQCCMGMNLREHVDLLVLTIQEIFQLLDLRFQGSNSLFQRLGISSRKSSSTQLVACLAFEPHIGALGATRCDAVASNLFAPTSVAGLGNPALGAGSNLDHFHGQNAWHGSSHIR